MTATQSDRDHRTVAAALAAFGRTYRPVIGFAYTPIAAPWFRLDMNGTPRDARGGDLDLSGVFELRAFTAAAELRWWNVPGQGGQERVLTDEVMAEQKLTTGDTYQRLLWGQVREPTDDTGRSHKDIRSTDGWSALFEARIGWLWVPMADRVRAGGRVAVEAVEYHREDEHGNVTVVDERLVGLTEVRNGGRG